MATEKENTKQPAAKDKAEKPSRVKRFFRAIANIPKRMWNAILNMIAELKKVTWPTLKDLRSYTGIVIVFMVIMALIVGLLDLGAMELISLIIRRS